MGRRKPRIKRKPGPSKQVVAGSQDGLSSYDLYSLLFGTALGLLTAVLPLTTASRVALWVLIAVCFIWPVWHSSYRLWTLPRRLLATVAVAALVAVLAAGTWPPVVSVAPTQFFVLNTGKSTNETTVAVTNHSDESLYSIWVLVHTTVREDKVEFRFERTGSDNFIGERVSLVGYGKERDGRMFYRVRLSRLEPGETERFAVIGMQNVPCFACAELEWYSDTPDTGTVFSDSLIQIETRETATDQWWRTLMRRAGVGTCHDQVMSQL